MTIGEVLRYIDSYNRREKMRLREKATFIYRLGDLVGISIGRYFDKRNTYPEIYEVFGELFSEEEIETSRQEERDRKSIERLMQMYEAQNNK